MNSPDPNIVNEIVSQANSQGVPSSIALAVANQESGFNPNAVGSSGEIGVFQLLPSSFPGQNISDVGTNIQLGIQYLGQLYQQFGDWASALMAYNLGPTRYANTVANGGAIPQSVQNYAASVLSNADANSGQVTTSPSLNLVGADEQSGGIDPIAIVAIAGAVGLVLFLEFS